MTILALDQATYTTGYTILKDGKIVVVNHFNYSDSDLGKRLLKIRNKIISLIQEYQVDEVVFEDIQLQEVNGSRETGVSTFKMLAELYGVVEETLTELNIKHTSVLPIKWKAHFKIAGKGRTQEKKMAQQLVLNKYNQSCTEDEADSLCIAQYYYDTTQNSYDWA